MKIQCGIGSTKVIRFPWLNILLPLIFLGCSTTTVVRQGQELFLGEQGVLITKDGKKSNVHHAQIRNDSIVVIDSRMGRKSRMPLSEAQKLVVKNRGQGAWQGMILFAGLGAVLGAIPDSNCGDPCLFPNGGVGGSVFWAILAAPVGALWGAVLGSHRNYVFAQTAPVSDSVSK